MYEDRSMSQHQTILTPDITNNQTVRAPNVDGFTTTFAPNVSTSSNYNMDVRVVSSSKNLPTTTTIAIKLTTSSITTSLLNNSFTFVCT